MVTERIESYLARISDASDLQGKRIGVVGLGMSNMALIDFLSRVHAELTVFDRQPAERLADRVAAVQDVAPSTRFILGPDYLAHLAAASFDYLFITPGMKKDQPELLRVCRKGAKVSSEMSLFFDLCPVGITGITGSAGKTTTTSLTGELIRASGSRVYVGGNIGKPLINEAAHMSQDERVVLELSSFQLELMNRGPEVAAVLNLSPNHIDVHGSMEAYREAKLRICALQRPGGRAVLNYDDRETRTFAGHCPGEVYWFSLQDQVNNGTYLDNERLVLVQDGEPVDGFSGLPVESIPLRGRHNVANVAAALTVAYLSGANPSCFADTVRGFRAVPHRLELVGQRNGVRFFNDSIATAPDRTLAALQSFTEPIVLIAGGYDKGIPFDSLAVAIVNRVQRLVLVGVTAPAIEKAVRLAVSNLGKPGPVIDRVSTFEQAVEAAAHAASPGSVVLLSPACASYDMFRNFEERGDRFRELVRAL